MSIERLIFRVHAIQRMFERQIDVGNIHQILEQGQVIEEYPGDKPFPSRLVMGRIGSRTFHVVVADNAASQEKTIITVYEPDPLRWETDFKRRKK